MLDPEGQCWTKGGDHGRRREKERKWEKVLQDRQQRSPPRPSPPEQMEPQGKLREFCRTVGPRSLCGCQGRTLCLLLLPGAAGPPCCSLSCPVTLPLIRGFTFCRFSYLRSVLVQKYQMENSRGKKDNCKPCAIQSSLLKSRCLLCPTWGVKHPSSSSSTALHVLCTHQSLRSQTGDQIHVVSQCWCPSHLVLLNSVSFTSLIHHGGTVLSHSIARRRASPVQ